MSGCSVHDPRESGQQAVFACRLYLIPSEKGGVQMIRVIGKNFQAGLVEEYHLHSLIASKKVIAFSRFNEWVEVGRDAVRERHTLYHGEERRRIVYGNDFCMK